MPTTHQHAHLPHARRPAAARLADIPCPGNASSTGLGAAVGTRPRRRVLRVLYLGVLLLLQLLSLPLPCCKCCIILYLLSQNTHFNISIPYPAPTVRLLLLHLPTAQVDFAAASIHSSPDEHGLGGIHPLVRPPRGFRLRLRLPGPCRAMLLRRPHQPTTHPPSPPPAQQ